uniref:2-amino-4-hydroxy-6-hydroxymethyldihydropteridine diphosphokinase n=1 Tax=Magnetococcus massalia (strain MO-1) TaxID=451514 RepID=A0A1S7LPE5_MAGMO|nr:2-amino-4-hydroxy-6-hydroxymethyldihydropteridinediphosphokinase [Candidatus Magnetococcus massalia]
MNDHRQQRTVLVGFGANIEPERNLIEGLERLHQAVGLQAISTVYQTAPIGCKPGTPPFYNGAVSFDTSLPAHQLRRLLREVESAQGRQRTTDRNASRPLDLDLLLIADQVVDDAELQIPDPEILQRPFLALPIAELAPQMIHPLERCTLAVIAQRCTWDPKQMQPLQQLTKRLQQLLGG